ncbi:MAG: helix-turn-helix domain-containing protein [Cyclobacteriaceae bacterium]|nr:helix-turn-helix domain-containing protein [Cyclobacteriaceae bacterium]
MSEIVVLNMSKAELVELINETINSLISKQSVSNDGKEDELIKIEEVCLMLKVSKVTIHKWKKSGMLPFHRISNRVFFKRLEILEVLRKINSPKLNNHQSQNVRYR